MLDHSWITTAESLIPSLAKDCSVFGKSIQLSETQKALNIPPQLVFICGLAIGDTHLKDEQSTRLITTRHSSPTFTKEQSDFFQHLQEIYRKQISSESPKRLYQMSPTLLPSEKTQSIIIKHVRRKEQELSEQASKQAKKLLLEVQQHDKQKRKSKNVFKNPKTPPGKNSIERIKTGVPKQSIALRMEVLDRNQNSKSFQSSLCTDIISQNDGEWKEVTKKKTTNLKKSQFLRDKSDGSERQVYNCNKYDKEDTEPNSVSKQNKLIEAEQTPGSKNIAKHSDLNSEANAGLSSESWGEQMEELSDKDSIEILKENTYITMGSEIEKIDGENERSVIVKKDKICEQSVVDNKSFKYEKGDIDDSSQNYTVLAKAASASSSDGELCNLRKRVEDLELELRAKEKQLEKERSAHAKALQLEQERFHERAQALQLRLYISETRLKTFEDALAAHLEAVEKNTADPRRSQRNEEEEYRTNKKPLFLRTAKK